MCASPGGLATVVDFRVVQRLISALLKEHEEPKYDVRKTGMRKYVNDHLAGWCVFTFWDCLASRLLVFAFTEVVLHNGFSRFEIKLNVFVSQCQPDSDKVNYFLELSVGWSVCNFLRACRDTNVKLVILTEITACGLRRGCKIQIISLCTRKVLGAVVLMIRTTKQI